MNARSVAAIVFAVLVMWHRSAAAVDVAAPWINGDFELGDATWTVGTGASVEDADANGDQEAKLVDCGDGDIRLARGVSKGVVPANTHVQFDVERDALTFYSFRMILLRADDPEPYTNNLFSLDPTGTLMPDYYDDHVLAWEPASGLPASLTGHVDLDPLDAIGVNIPSWGTMTREQRQTELLKYTHMSLAIYGCGTAAGTTLDKFIWSYPLPN